MCQSMKDYPTQQNVSHMRVLMPHNTLFIEFQDSALLIFFFFRKNCLTYVLTKVCGVVLKHFPIHYCQPQCPAYA